MCIGLREYLKVFREAVEAVKEVHERGVVHFDVKLSNFLVGEDRAVSQESEEVSLRMGVGC